MLELISWAKENGIKFLFCKELTGNRKSSIFHLINFLKIVTELSLCDTLTNNISCIADEMF